MVRRMTELAGFQPYMMEQFRRPRLPPGPTDGEPQASQEIDSPITACVDKLLDSRKLLEHLRKYQTTKHGELGRFLIKRG